jgi:hypothetical protein
MSSVLGMFVAALRKKFRSGCSGHRGPGYFDNLAGFLVAPDRGFLVWTPLALLLLPAVIRHWRSSPLWARWLALAGLFYTAVQLELNGFSGGDAFYGDRLGLELLVCITPVYALSLGSTGKVARVLAPFVAGLQLAVISLGALVEGIWLPDEQAWTSNSAVEALRAQPLLVGSYLSVCVLAGALATRLMITRTRSSSADRPTAEFVEG